MVDRVIKPHIEGLILNGIPEQELKTILLDCHGEIEEIADEIKLAKEIKTQGKLNDGRMKDFVESIPQFKEALELIPDV